MRFEHTSGVFPPPSPVWCYLRATKIVPPVWWLLNAMRCNSNCIAMRCNGKFNTRCNACVLCRVAQGTAEGLTRILGGPLATSLLAAVGPEYCLLITNACQVLLLQGYAAHACIPCRFHHCPPLHSAKLNAMRIQRSQMPLWRCCSAINKLCQLHS